MAPTVKAHAFVGSATCSLTSKLAKWALTECRSKKSAVGGFLTDHLSETIWAIDHSNNLCLQKEQCPNILYLAWRWTRQK